MIENRLTLSSILVTTAQCLADVESGRSLSVQLARVHPSERGAVQALSMYAMRHWGLAQAWRSIAMQRPSSIEPLNSLVAMSLLLLDIAMLTQDASGAPDQSPSLQCPLGEDAPRYAVHTVVDQAVGAARHISKAAFAPKLLNAILRRFQRERATFVAAVQQDDVAIWNCPAWWMAQLRQTYPAQWQSILRVGRAMPDLVIRVNRRNATVDQVLQAMNLAGVPARQVGEVAIRLEVTGSVERLPGYHEGWWSVQDLSAQRAAPLLMPTAGMRVLDACSAPGGKAAHLLELADIELTAVDQDAMRLDRVRVNLQRLGLLDERRVTLVQADLRHSKSWRRSQPYDLILADVPCTASGVLRRHPDIAWLRRPSDLKQTVKLQREILDALWPALAPGGRMLLVTCSVFEQEGELQAQAMLSRHSDAQRLPAPGQILPAGSQSETGCGYDGFFYALFAKRG